MDRAAVARRNIDSAIQARPALQIRIDFLDGRDGIDDGEIDGGVESGDQRPALRRAVAVRDHHRHVFHVRRRRVPEQRQLDDRRDDDDAEQARILPKLEKFLPDETAKALHVSRPPAPASRTRASA